VRIKRAFREVLLPYPKASSHGLRLSNSSVYNHNHPWVVKIDTTDPQYTHRQMDLGPSTSRRPCTGLFLSLHPLRTIFSYVTRVLASPLLRFSPLAHWRRSAMFKSRCSALQICLTDTSRWKPSNGEESFGWWPRGPDGDHFCCNGMFPLHLLYFKPPLSHGQYTRCKFPTNSHNDLIYLRVR
jgi:hypothetical protein